MSKYIKIDSPSWQTVTSWTLAMIETHSKKSYTTKQSAADKTPAQAAKNVFEDMSKAADLAAQLQKENEQLKKQIITLKKKRGN